MHHKQSVFLLTIRHNKDKKNRHFVFIEKIKIIVIQNKTQFTMCIIGKYGANIFVNTDTLSISIIAHATERQPNNKFPNLDLSFAVTA